MKNEIHYKDITYPNLVELQKLGLLSKVESIAVYPAQIEFKFDERLDENHKEVLNDWFIDFFMNLSDVVMDRSCMTSCTMIFSISENYDLLCRVEAEANPSSDLYVDFGVLNDDDYEVEEWVETINMVTYFNQLGAN
tara:strand:- start:168 stop:578 length:411 start_codon:yes stop_codon:yes gene_type:complete